MQAGPAGIFRRGFFLSPAREHRHGRYRTPPCRKARKKPGTISVPGFPLGQAKGVKTCPRNVMAGHSLCTWICSHLHSFPVSSPCSAVLCISMLRGLCRSCKVPVRTGCVPILIVWKNPDNRAPYASRAGLRHSSISQRKMMSLFSRNIRPGSRWLFRGMS